ncbi:unnamed protein product [Spirodela intermedia]|uniref:Uncharacterized protein n=1 Tax=Spirodela intermedia TaxID=51605 RepID=A0A7I8I803_SPIIN|nr:unnamed protein product [Spirodela intermedia]CAA6653523.1 unnamed protein product [Spirodela intermedia]
MMYDRPYESFVRLFLACEARNATKSAEGTIRARLYHNPRQLESHPEKLGELPMPTTPVFASTAGTTAKGSTGPLLQDFSSGEAAKHHREHKSEADSLTIIHSHPTGDSDE